MAQGGWGLETEWEGSRGRFCSPNLTICQVPVATCPRSLETSPTAKPGPATTAEGGMSRPVSAWFREGAEREGLSGFMWTTNAVSLLVPQSHPSLLTKTQSLVWVRGGRADSPPV